VGTFVGTPLQNAEHLCVFLSKDSLRRLLLQSSSPLFDPCATVFSRSATDLGNSQPGLEAKGPHRPAFD
jgi:hypothetical protein